MAKGGSGIDDDAPDDMKKSGEDDFGGGGGGGTVGSADVSEEGPAIVKVDLFLWAGKYKHTSKVWKMNELES